MILEATITLLLGVLAFQWGTRAGRVLVRKGATAKNIFKGKNAVSLAFLGIYIGLLFLALYVPQFQGLPLEWRVYGMRVTWTMMRVMLLGVCGIAFIVSWKTARVQVIAVALLAILGLGGFTASEHYFLSPIYPYLKNNLLPNGIFEQTSDSSCAPAALATILRRWGLSATESEVARLAGTSRLGTSMPQLITAAQALGMDGLELSPSWAQMQQINRPGILATWLYSDRGRAPHAVGLVGLTDQTATVADPAFGEFYRVSRDQFDRLWRQEYVPIFRPGETVLVPAQVADYLHRLGHLNSASVADPTALKQALKQFQTVVGVEATGELTPETALLLSGPFREDTPTLDRFDCHCH